jgi:hypothetical protein
MSDPMSKDSVLLKLDAKRRDFLKGILGAGFAAPLLATFSIDALSVESANAQSVCNTYANTCGDTGYVGPGAFQAHLAEPRASAGGPNGEATLTVNGRSIATGIGISVTLVNGAVLSSLYLIVSGSYILIPMNAANVSNGLITNNTLEPYDLDEVLNAMAFGQVNIQVQGTYRGEPFTIAGQIIPGTVADSVNLVP